MMLLSQAAHILGWRTAWPRCTVQRRVQRQPGDCNRRPFCGIERREFRRRRIHRNAARSGAVAALVEEQGIRNEEQTSCSLLLVPYSSRLALGRLAAHWRGQFSIPVVAVTGSNGKTTVKEMLPLSCA